MAAEQPDDALHEPLGQRDVMDVQDGRQAPLRADLGKKAHDLAACLVVAAGSRFIRQQKLGLLRQRTGDADPLSLSARKRVGPLVGLVHRAHAVERPIGAPDVLGREAAQPAAPERHVTNTARKHVFHHRQPLDERVFLEDHPDPAPLPPELGLPDLREVDIARQHKALGRLNQPVDSADERRLARAGRPDKAHDLAFGYRERHVVQCLVAGPVRLRKAFDPQDRASPQGCTGV